MVAECVTIENRIDQWRNSNFDSEYIYIPQPCAQAHAARNRSLKSEVEAAEGARDDAGMDRERASKQCAELTDEATRLRRQVSVMQRGRISTHPCHLCL